MKYLQNMVMLLDFIFPDLEIEILLTWNACLKYEHELKTRNVSYLTAFLISSLLLAFKKLHPPTALFLLQSGREKPLLQPQ